MSCQNKIFITSQCDKSTLELTRDLFEESEQIFPEEKVQAQLRATEGQVAGIKLPFKMETKYYIAHLDIWLDVFQDHDSTIQAYVENKEIGQAIGAFVFLCNKLEDFNLLKLWMPFLNQAETPIRLCINQSHQGTEEMNDWCLEHGFDYLDMDDTSDNALDKVGIALVLEILQTHLWDGLERKEGQNSSREEQELIQEIQALKMLDDDCDMPTPEEINETRDQLFGTLDDLDKTFALLQSMKEHGKTLPDEERRKMAAKVALSFAAQLGI